MVENATSAMGLEEKSEYAIEDILDLDEPYIKSDLPVLIDSIERESKEEIDTIAILVSRFVKSEGAARVAEQHAIELSEQFDVDILTFEYDGFSDSTNVINIQDNAPIGQILSSINAPNILYRGTFLFNPIDNLALSKKLSTYDITLLHQPNLGLYTLFPDSISNHKTVYFNHHIRRPSDRLLDDVWDSITGGVKDKIIRNSDWHVSVSKSSRQEFYDRFGEKSFVVYNRLSPGRFETAADVSDLVTGSKVALFVGRITPHKGILELIDICDQVSEEVDEDFELIIVGQSTSDTYRADVEKQAESAELNVSLVGECSDEQLTGLYERADIYLSCSIKEGFNLPVLEAQLFGTPVVVYDIGPHWELVELGALVEPEEPGTFKRKIIEHLQDGN